MLAPVGVGAGVLSNQVNDAVGTIVAGTDDNQLTRAQVPLTTTVLDRTGAPIATLYDQYRLPVTYDGIAKTMDAAIIAIEDRRFFTEAGVDPRAVLRAAVNNSSGGSTQGASTITQQYVKNYLINVIDRTDPAAQRADRADTISRKVREAELALQLAHNVPKEQILAGYLNVVEFSGSVYGVAAAAHAYFGTTRRQAHRAAGRAAGRDGEQPEPLQPLHAPPAGRRTGATPCSTRWSTTGSITAAAAATAKAAPLGVVPGGPAAARSTCFAAAPDAGFFCDYAVRYLEQAGFTADQLATGGYTIKTTMDPVVSQAAKDAVDRNVPDRAGRRREHVRRGHAGHGGPRRARDGGQPQPRHRCRQGRALDQHRRRPEQRLRRGLVVQDLHDGGGAGAGHRRVRLRPAQPRFGLLHPAQRQPVHALLPGLQRRRLRRPDLAPGRARDLAQRGVRRPGGPHGHARGGADGPAARAAAHPRVQRRGQCPGHRPGRPALANPLYNEPQSQYFQGLLSFTLGVSPVSPLEMANVTATILSDGVWCPPNPIQSVTDRDGKPVAVAQQPCEQVVNPGLAHTLAAGLAKDTTDGTSAAAAGAAGWHRPDIGKTGTTNESESVAFIGGVDGYAAASMVYADSSHPQEICPGRPVHLGNCGHGAFGGTVAAPPYFAAFNQLLDGQARRGHPRPRRRLPRRGRPAAGRPVRGRAAGPGGRAGRHGGGLPHADCGRSRPSLPQGQVVGESPQGNLAPGTPVTIWTSAGK